MSKSKRKERLKKKRKYSMVQIAVANMTERERSIYSMGVSIGRKSGAMEEKRRIAERLLEETGIKFEIIERKD